MAKLDAPDRLLYLKKIQPYRTTIQSLITKKDQIEDELGKNFPGASLKRLILTEDMLTLFSNYMVLNGVSEVLLQNRNEDALEKSRKSIYVAIKLLEDTVSPLIDSPFSEYEEMLSEIASVKAKRRYSIIKKLGIAIRILQRSYEHNSRWKWAFVELEGRYAAVAKNILDLKTVIINMDPRSSEYESTLLHLRLVKKHLSWAASRYRDKYELFSNSIDDFNMGIRFLEALRRLHIILGESADAEEVKKKTGIWNTKLQVDIKKNEEGIEKKV